MTCFKGKKKLGEDFDRWPQAWSEDNPFPRKQRNYSETESGLKKKKKLSLQEGLKLLPDGGQRDSQLFRLIKSKRHTSFPATFHSLASNLPPLSPKL